MVIREVLQDVRLLAGSVLLFVIFFLIGCASPAATATPLPPEQPATPSAPTAAPQPTATLMPGAPTPTIEGPTPTRTLPTATPVSVGKPVYGGTLIVAQAESTDTFDPAFNTEPGALVVMYNLYEGMLDSDAQGNIVPGLAKSWDISADGKTITFHLREGVKFQDGTGFNAQAVKWNIDRIMDPAQLSVRRSEIAPYLAGISVIDDQTVEMQLKQAFRPLLPTMATDRLGFLVSPAAVEKYGGGRQGGYGRQPVGTGPFKLIEWVVGQRYVLERNNNYWKTGVPYLDRIVVLETIPQDVQKAMIRTAEANIINYYAVSGIDLPIMERNPGIRVQIQKGGGTFFFKFNTSIAPYNNKALRQAFSYAIDRDVMVKTVFGGLGQAAYTLISGGWAHSPDLKPITYDLTKAKQKMAEAGYPNGVTMKIGCNTADVNLMGMCEAAQAMVKEVGIDLQIERLVAAGYYNPQIGYLAKPGFGPTPWAIRVDPNTLIQLIFHSKGFDNQGAYSNPEVDRLIGEAAGAYDIPKAKALYDQIQTVVAEDAYNVFINWRYNFYTSTTSVQGYEPYIPPVKHYLGNVWLKK